MFQADNAIICFQYFIHVKPSTVQYLSSTSIQCKGLFFATLSFWGLNIPTPSGVTSHSQPHRSFNKLKNLIWRSLNSSVADPADFFRKRPDPDLNKFSANFFLEILGHSLCKGKKFWFILTILCLHVQPSEFLGNFLTMEINGL
jgi:hypothetical protein